MPAKGARVSGFTLIEVMMAATILVVGFIGLIQAVTIGSEMIDTSRKQQVAMQIMAGEIERLRSGPWTTIAGLPSSASISISQSGVATGNETSFAICNYTSTNGDDNTALLGLARGFTCSFARTRLRPGSATSSTVTYLEIVYTVQWTSNTGRTYSRTEQAYFGENGLHLSYQK
jgi:prepilin-type N-terminal cleavage/methylation domain-containing protein